MSNLCSRISSIPGSFLSYFSSLPLQEQEPTVSSSQKLENFIEKLPPELLENIFNCLNPKEFQAVAKLNRNFRALFLDIAKNEEQQKINNFIKLIFQEINREPIDKEVYESDKKQLESIGEDLLSVKSLTQIKLVYSKAEIEFFFLLKDLSKERIEVLQKACQDESLWESFEEVFNWIKDIKG